MARNDDPIELRYDSVKKQTDNAVFVVFGDDFIWVPKSIIEDRTDETITLPEWFVAEYELECYEN